MGVPPLAGELLCPPRRLANLPSLDCKCILFFFSWCSHFCSLSMCLFQLPSIHFSELYKGGGEEGRREREKKGRQTERLRLPSCHHHTEPGGRRRRRRKGAETV